MDSFIVWHLLCCFCLDKFRQSKPTVGWSKLVWYNQNIPKMSFILWLAIKCKLSIMDRILTFASSVLVTCVLCSSATEFDSHLFECPFTDGIWSSVLFKCGVPWLRVPWPLFVMWATSRCKGKSLSSIVLKLSLVVTVYYVWRERNNRRFKNSSQPAGVVLNSIKSTIRLRLSSLKITRFVANDSTL
ncbi:hypothetical protein PS2_027956 [Malus domestica]